MTMSDLWTEATRDIESEERLKNLEMARHASQGIWSFLAQAGDQFEYEDRLSLAQDRIGVIASQTGVTEDELIKVFDQRFALLLEAKGNYSVDDAPDDDKDDDGNPDDEQSDEEDSEEADEEKGSNSDDDGDDSDDDKKDPDPDDTDAGQEKDPDDDGDDDSDPNGDTDGDFFPPKSSARYASLMERIQAGENPLSWGGAAPFAGSPARKTAGLDDGAVTDSNVPQDPTANTDSGPGMGAAPLSLPETTKPRQLPEGGGGSSDMLAGGEPLDPALNGGDIQAGSDDLPPATSSRHSKVASIAADVRQYNPHLSQKQCEHVAEQVVARYYKQAEDLSPLLYGDRGNVGDGPLTEKAKEWEPSGSGKKPGGGNGGGGSPSTPPALPRGGDPIPVGSGGGAPELPPAGEGAAAATGEAAAGEGLLDLAPLLAL